MEKLKISFANIVSIIFAALFGFVCFLSFIFLWQGNIQKSILFAVAISFLLWLWVFILKKIKSVRRNFQRNAIFEIIVLVIYILIAVILTILPYSHYYTVSDRRDVIKGKIIAEVDNTIKMFDDYETYASGRIGAYEEGLNIAIAGQNMNGKGFLAAGFQNNGQPINTQKNLLMRIFKDDLMPSQYDTIKVYAIKWLNEAKITATEWKPIGLINVINSIEKESNNWKNELIGYSNSTAIAKVGPFQYTNSFSSVVQELTQRATPTFFAIISAILLYLLILFPYFFKYRDPRHSGLLNELLKNGNEKDEIGTTL